MPYDIDPRLLRAFTAVAEELHFTRAAARLYVAQQALSRDIRRLERELGATLFVRSTRRVALTADGERLLPYARRVLAAQDELAAAFRSAPEQPLLVDVSVPIGTAHGVLEAARGRVPDDCELVARFHSGLTGAAAEMAAGRLDVSFGRYAALPADVRAGLDHQPVRLEPMAVLLRDDHPLAARPTPSRSRSWPARRSTRPPGIRRPWSGRIWPSGCSRGARSRRPRRSRRSRARRSSSASCASGGGRCWRVWSSWTCRGWCCGRSSSPYRCRRCRWCGGAGCGIRDWTRCALPRRTWESGTPGWCRPGPPGGSRRRTRGRWAWTGDGPALRHVRRK